MGAMIFLRNAADLIKSQVKGYTKGDGTYVAPHSTKVHAKAKPVKAAFDHKAPLPAEAFANVGAPTELPPAPAPKPKAAPKQMALWGKPSGIVGAQYGGKTPAQWGGQKLAKLEPEEPQGEPHPQENDKGEPVYIKKPSAPSAPATWSDPAAIATFVPDGDVPAELGGVAFAPWEDAPTTNEGWASVPGQMLDLDEPLMVAAKTMDGKGFKERAAGVIIEEPDGRVWVMRPTNGFGGYDATFPKGRAEKGLSLQASAIKEAFEETGLQVEITGYHGDIERSTTVGRYYTARRVGGSPAHMGWEAQAVQLVPKEQLASILNTPVDRKIAVMGNANANNMKKD